MTTTINAYELIVETIGISLFEEMAAQKGRPNYHKYILDTYVLPVMDRVNAFTGQENDPDYIAYLFEHLVNMLAAEH